MVVGTFHDFCVLFTIFRFCTEKKICCVGREALNDYDSSKQFWFERHLFTNFQFELMRTLASGISCEERIKAIGLAVAVCL